MNFMKEKIDKQKYSFTFRKFKTSYFDLTVNVVVIVKYMRKGIFLYK